MLGHTIEARRMGYGSCAVFIDGKMIVPELTAAVAIRLADKIADAIEDAENELTNKTS